MSCVGCTKTGYPLCSAGRAKSGCVERVSKERKLYEAGHRHIWRWPLNYCNPICFCSEAEVLDHTKTPCANKDDFVPETQDKIYVFYITMKSAHDFQTWKNVASCLRMWDLDARGFHKSMWRFWIKKNHVLVVGCPASEYCSYKPVQLTPLYIPEKPKQ